MSEKITFDGLTQASLARPWSPDEASFCYADSAAAWAALTPLQRMWLGRTVEGFTEGETAVSSELYHLLSLLEHFGWSDARDYVAVQIVEELRHHRFFMHWRDAVGIKVGNEEYRSGIAAEKNILRRMERNMRALRTDRSPEALARGLAGYHLSTEGIVGFTLIPLLGEIGAMHPGFTALSVGSRYLHQDEARHYAFGEALCRKLVAVFGVGIVDTIVKELREFGKLTTRAALIGFGSQAELHEGCFGFTAQSILAKVSHHSDNRFSMLKTLRGL